MAQSETISTVGNCKLSRMYIKISVIKFIRGNETQNYTKFLFWI
jgi:hypothetical protein